MKYVVVLSPAVVATYWATTLLLPFVTSGMSTSTMGAFLGVLLLVLCVGVPVACVVAVIWAFFYGLYDAYMEPRRMDRRYAEYCARERAEQQHGKIVARSKNADGALRRVRQQAGADHCQ